MSDSFVQINDLGFDHFLDQTHYLETHYVKAGLPDGEPMGVPERSGSHEGYIDKYELLEVAIVHEFGSRDGTIPERSFVRAAIDEARNEIADLKERLYNRMLQGKIDADQVLDTIGIRAADLIVNKIDSLQTPPNTAATIKRKGSSNPLVDTGQMKQSIAYVIAKLGVF